MRTRLLFLPVFFSIPLNQMDGWHLVKYKNAPANTVQFTDSSLKIEVNRSASPLFFDLKGSKKIKSVSAKGFAAALPSLSNLEEGVKKGDDFPLRIGLVEPSKKSLSWIKKLFAPKWIKELLEIEPNKGVEKVHFLTLAQKLALGTKRIHPKSALLHEEVVAQLPVSGPFAFHHILENPIESFAIWIQADGDDTKSSYTIELKELILEFQD